MTKTFERLKLAEFHLHSFHISSVRLSALATGALIHAVLLFSLARWESTSRQTEQKPATLILPHLSVNIHISSYNVLRIVRPTLLIQHTNDPGAGLHGIKSQPTHWYRETSLQFPHISAGAAEAPRSK